MNDSAYKRKNQLWILIKLKLAELFFGNRSKKKNRTLGEKAGRAIGGTALVILYIISFGLIAVSLGFLFYLLSETLAVGVLKWMYYAYMAILMFLLCFVGSVFLTETQMFEAKDNERLMAMPISPWNILVSRMISLLFFNYIFSAIVSVPAVVVSLIRYEFNLKQFIFLIIAVLIIPLFALAVSMLFGWLISVLSKKFKSTRFLKLGLAIAASMLYFYFVLGDEGWVNSLINNGAQYAESIKNYMPPVYSIGQALAFGENLHFVFMLLWCIVPFVIVTLIISRNFLKSISMGNTAASFKYKSTGAKVRSPLVSLANIETGRFLSSITYIMNGGMGLLLMAIMAIFSISNKDNLGDLTLALTMSGVRDQGIIGGIMLLGILGVMGLVTISSATISLDANTLWIPKSIPAKGSDIILSKAWPHIFISIPFIVVTAILLQLNIKMSIAARILMIIIPLTANVFNAIMGVRINARFPKFNWTNEAQAIKQGMASLLVMVLGIIPVMIFIPGVFFLVLQSRISMTGLMVIMEIVYIVLSLWMILWAKKKGDAVIYNLQN